jgi:DNA polymerase-1
MNRLVIIDGNAILHRAFHALPPLTDPDGNVVNAVYGFTTMLFRLITELKPTHLAVVFDRPAPTFRKKMFKDYQATRPKMDDELIPQVDRVHELVRAFGIPIYEKDGFEADDVIGTLCQLVSRPSSAESRSIDQAIVVTGDRDLMQLVQGEKVYVYMPVKGLSESRLYGENEVKEKIGVPPNKIIEYKGLAGDPSDNYPGVGGIGPKTAVTLIEEYGSVGGIYDSLDKGSFKGSDTVKDKLVAGRANALLSKELATIKTDVPVAVAVPDLVLKPIDTPAAREYLSKLHFFSLLKRLAGGEEKAEKKEKKEKKKNTEKDESKQPSLF